MRIIFWLLGPLAVLLFTVVGYGSLELVGSGQGSWADYLFWGTMALGTLPAVVQLAWVQVDACRCWLYRRLRNSRKRPFPAAMHI